MTEHLTSTKNPKVLAWRSLQERKGRLAHGAFLAEGDRMAAEALASPFPVEALLIRTDRYREMTESHGAPEDVIPQTDPRERASGETLPKRCCAGTDRIRLADLPEELPVFVLADHVFAAVSDTKTPQGIAAVVRMRPKAPEGGRLLALDGVQDPGNVGTILRTADAAGLDGVILSPDCADVFAPKTLRATMGSIFRVGLMFPADLAECLRGFRSRGYSILSSQLDGDPFYDRRGVEKNWVLVIGNEGNGVSDPVKAGATHRLRLPMRGGAESLNAAVAAGIMMYEMMR